MLPIAVLKPGDTIRFKKGTGVVIDYFGEIACEVYFNEITYRSILSEHYDVNDLFNKDKYDEHLGVVLSVGHSGRPIDYMELRLQELRAELNRTTNEAHIEELEERIYNLKQRMNER